MRLAGPSASAPLLINMANSVQSGDSTPLLGSMIHRMTLFRRFVVQP